MDINVDSIIKKPFYQKFYFKIENCTVIVIVSIWLSVVATDVYILKLLRGVELSAIR